MEHWFGFGFAIFRAFASYASQEEPSPKKALANHHHWSWSWDKRPTSAKQQNLCTCITSWLLGYLVNEINITMYFSASRTMQSTTYMFN